ncbi:30S ribosomal protein S9 [Phycisphaerae bacterium RAS1]|nr:30S ribosomal protein S9 [Phycisphaerae bacterium RAS1]
MSEMTAPTSEQAAPSSAKGGFWGTGRRKTSVARVRVVPGGGKFLVNGRDVDKYFTEIEDRSAARAPLAATSSAAQWDIQVNVHGGGVAGQAGAVRLGIARALVEANSSFEATLRDAGYLTRDARAVERKKYGRAKARRRFQFSKR